MQVEYEEAPATFSTSEILPRQAASDHSDEEEQDDDPDVEEEEEEEEPGKFTASHSDR